MRSIVAMIATACMATLAAGSSLSLFSPSPSWEVTGMDAPPGFFGERIASAGDVNGDGFEDILTSAPFLGIDGMSRAGAAFIYFGRPGGPSTTPDWTMHGAAPDETLGSRVAPAGDVNGDGYDDVLVGAPVVDKVYLVWGSATGPSGGGPPRIIDGTVFGVGTVINGRAVREFGGALASGDFNGDGFSDVAIGAPYYAEAGGPAEEGAAFVYSGRPQGLFPGAGWIRLGGSAYARLGQTLAAGDLDADGDAELIVGSPQAGTVSVHSGSEGGLALDFAWSAPMGFTFGSALTCAGDLNGDGYGDLVVGADQIPPDVGSVFTYYGGPQGPSGQPDGTLINPAPSTPTRGTGFGFSLAPAGDVDADGIADLVVGGFSFPLYEGGVLGGIDRGTVWVYRGGPQGIGPAPVAELAGRPGEFFGYTLAHALNPDGSGASAILVGTSGRPSMYVSTVANRAPTAPDQREINGTMLAPGTMFVGDSVRLGAVVRDPLGGMVRLQVEVKPAGTDFDDTGLVEGSGVSAWGRDEVTFGGLGAGTGYHWRGRCVFDGADPSPWVEFAGDDPAVPDFIARTNVAPVAGALRQIDPVTGSDIASAATVEGLNVRFEAALADGDAAIDPAERISLQIEVRPSGAGFTGTPTASSGPGVSGSFASVSLEIPDPGRYSWRARAVDRSGAASAWATFDGDFTINHSGSLGRSDCAGSAGSAPPVTPAFLLLAAGLLAIGPRLLLQSCRRRTDRVPFRRGGRSDPLHPVSLGGIRG